MSIRVYSEINLHITWHTKNSLKMIDEKLQPELYAFLKNKIVETRGAYFHAIGGIETHIHIAASVKPSVHLDEWIGQLKGASSFEMGKDLQWQAGYGIVSFGTKDLKFVIDYIFHQQKTRPVARLAAGLFDYLEKSSVSWQLAGGSRQSLQPPTAYC